MEVLRFTEILMHAQLLCLDHCDVHAFLELLPLERPNQNAHLVVLEVLQHRHRPQHAQPEVVVHDFGEGPEEPKTVWGVPKKRPGLEIDDAQNIF